MSVSNGESAVSLSPPQKTCLLFCHTLSKPFPTDTYIVVERCALDALWGVAL